MYAKKSFGQHFLVDKNVIDAILDAVRAEKGETIIEIGPGTGALTKGLAALGSPLVLVEADKDLIPRLRAEFPQSHVVMADAAIVDFSFSVLSTGMARHAPSWLLVGNLPYNAASAIVMNALTSTPPPRRMVVMVQKEVGDRMLCKKGSMSVLSVACGLYADVEELFIVPPHAFNPKPKVDSMVIALTPKPESTLHVDVKRRPSREAIIALAKVGFAHRRKQLHSNFAEGGVCTSAEAKKFFLSLGLPADVRAEALSVVEWEKLAFSVLP